MKHVYLGPLLTIGYTLMALWLLIAGARRIALEIAEGAQLDWAPFASAGLGGICLLLLIPAIDEWDTRRRQW